MNIAQRFGLSVRPLPLVAALAAAVALVAPGLASAAPASRLDPNLKVHPLLQVGAQHEPNRKVHLIVQKQSRDDDSLAIAQRLGVDIDEEFSVAGAISLEVPQKRALELARDPHVRYISLDGPVHGHSTSSTTSSPLIDTSHLLTTYPDGITATSVWNNTTGQAATGAGVTVAVLDSGVNSNQGDIAGPNLISVNVNKAALGAQDGNGHGTHVVGIIKGRNGQGQYIGVAPDARVISVKISDDQGVAHESDLLRGLQWVYDNRATYNIRAANLSVSAATAESYKTSVIDAAAEQLWFNNVTVVAAAGNRGTASDAVWYAPANDPYVITVGCIDDNNTATNYLDDSVCTFSSRGTTQDGYPKPDVYAPGRRIYSALAGSDSVLALQMPTHISPDGKHIRLSGTSMSAPMVTGLAALLYQNVPTLTPNQVKWLVQSTSRNYTGQAKGDPAGEIHAVPAISTAIAPGSKGLGSANAGLTPNGGINAANGTVMWGTSYWDSSYWDSSYWDSSYWDVAATYD